MGAFAAAIIAINPPASAQTSSPAPTSTTPDAVRWIAAVQTDLKPGTMLTAGVLYLGGLRTSGPFLLMDQAIDEGFGIQIGYFYTVSSLPGSQSYTSHFARAGFTYRAAFSGVLIDNRALYERVLTEQGRQDVQRFRNRLRISLDIAPANRLKPGVVAFIEPVIDDQMNGLSRLDLALGGGAAIAKGIRLDVYGLRQIRYGETVDKRNALVVQLIFKIP